MEKQKWIVINYNLPTEPSRHRVAIWRGLKKMGAVNIQQSMWILPEDEENYSALKRLTIDIEANNGEAFLMETMFFDEKHEGRVVSLFNAMRSEEYMELISECMKYLKEIEKEIHLEKFTFPELEEEEAELEKLVSWHGKIKKRDIFGAPKGEEADELLAKAGKAFEGFSELVYRKEVR